MDKNKIGQNKYYKILIVVSIIYFIMVQMNFLTENNIVVNSFYLLIPYSIINALGMELKYLNKKTIISIITIFFITFSIFLIYYFIQEGKFISTQNYKYPPSVYYISYALVISLILYLLVSEKCSNLNLKFIYFVTKNSLWFYFWHILFVNIRNIKFSNLNWIIAYIVTIICTSIMTYIQFKVVRKIEKKFGKNLLTNIFKG